MCKAMLKKHSNIATFRFPFTFTGYTYLPDKKGNTMKSVRPTVVDSWG